LIHLYYKTTSSKQVQDTKNAFGDCKVVDISNLQSIGYDEVFLVEIDQIEKNILIHIRKLLQNKTQSLIYFFIKDSHSLILFQLASLLNVKTIVTPKHDVAKLILNIKKELLNHRRVQQEHAIAKTLVNDECFVVFSSDKLMFASKKLYDDFKCENLEMVESKICSQIDVRNFLDNNITEQNSFKFTSSPKIYNIRSMTSSFNNDTYLYIDLVPQTKNFNVNSLDFIKNRIYFIEILKEKVLESSITQCQFSIITIQVENISNLREYWSEYEIEMAIRDLLLQLEISIESFTLLAQYDNNLYLTLFEGLDFEQTKQKAYKMQAHISAYTSTQDIKPVIGLYAFDINNLELNNILKIISDISSEDISRKDIETKKIYRIIELNNELDDSRAIDILLQATFTNQVPIKLLNIYKGLCINTPSEIVKKTDQEVYVTYEPLQGTVMHFEKETIMQSSNFTKDIVADVQYIDQKKKLALLKNFRFVQGSANARKYSRVTCSQRTPISIAYAKGNISGIILDISMNSIAVKTRFYKQVESLNLAKVTLNFTLPISSNEDGFMKLSLTSEVMVSVCDDKYCKIVMNLDEDQAHESILMEYVYSRQKEIITELKKQTTVLN
jgi:hypothetical protein